MLKRFIFKTNEWYEGLPQIWGNIFFPALTLAPYILLVLGLDKPHGFVLGIIWIMTVYVWRISYVIMKGIQNAKENNEKNDNQEDLIL